MVFSLLAITGVTKSNSRKDGFIYYRGSQHILIEDLVQTHQMKFRFLH